MVDYILNRPMFQRPLTREQLSQYGIQAFANGGIVVQKFAKGKLAEKLKLATDEELTQLGIERDPNYEYYIKDGKLFRQLKKDPTETSPEDLMTPEGKPDVYVGGSPMRPFTKEEEKGTPIDEEIGKERVPENIKKAKTPEELRKALLIQPSAPGTSKAIKDKITSLQSDIGDEQREQLSELENLVKERSALYKQILGDPKEALKQQGFLQLAQFGLNLASAQGGNLAQKLAKSAQDPLQAFAALGREAMQDERAIDMLAIKGAEEEIARKQKPGTFGQLVQDLVNTKGLSPEKAAEEATRIYEQKSGKTIAEMKDERYSELLALYTQELGEVDKAVEAANAQIQKEFGTGMFLEQTNQNNTTGESITDLT